MSSPRVRFGLVAPSSRSEIAGHVDELAATIAGLGGLDLTADLSATYGELADKVKAGALEAAWLPPIVFVRTSTQVDPLGAIDRGGAGKGYESALVVREDSVIESVDELRGVRAGWVDPWSAAGFVMPRVKLALVGVDPRTLFRTEQFHGSHRAALEALAEGACDVVGTHAQRDADGAVSSGAWMQITGTPFRVLATFGAIPPDVVAVQKEMPAPVRASLLGAFRRAAEEPATRQLLEALFGGTSLREGAPAGYVALESALAVATARGLFD